MFITRHTANMAYLDTLLHYSLHILFNHRLCKYNMIYDTLSQTFKPRITQSAIPKCIFIFKQMWEILKSINLVI